MTCGQRSGRVTGGKRRRRAIEARPGSVAAMTLHISPGPRGWSRRPGGRPGGRRPRGSRSPGPRGGSARRSRRGRGREATRVSPRAPSPAGGTGRCWSAAVRPGQRSLIRRAMSRSANRTTSGIRTRRIASIRPQPDQADQQRQADLRDQVEQPVGRGPPPGRRGARPKRQPAQPVERQQPADLARARRRSELRWDHAPRHPPAWIRQAPRDRRRGIPPPGPDIDDYTIWARFLRTHSATSKRQEQDQDRPGVPERDRRVGVERDLLRLGQVLRAASRTSNGV